MSNSCCLFSPSDLVAYRRVRCDRILWKSTIMPEPDEPEEEESPAPSAPPRTRMSQFLHVFRPHRTRRDSQFSVNSLTSPEASDTEGESDLRVSPRTHAPSSPLSRQPRRLLNSKSTDAFPRFEKTPLDRIRSHQPPVESTPNRLRKASLPIPSMDSLDTSITTPDTSFAQLTIPDLSSSTAISDSPPPLPPKDIPPPTTSIWRNIFHPPFLSRDTPRLSHVEPESPPHEEQIPLPEPRRGDVVCLGYHTLDDKGMKRLMGRSDHRPVIGSYALYI